ncbi:MAG: hypothetical protein ACLQGP_26195 [Isosphaeraceae bacterium]
MDADEAIATIRESWAEHVARHGGDPDGCVPIIEHVRAKIFAREMSVAKEMELQSRNEAEARAVRSEHAATPVGVTPGRPTPLTDEHKQMSELRRQNDELRRRLAAVEGRGGSDESESRPAPARRARV